MPFVRRDVNISSEIINKANSTVHQLLESGIKLIEEPMTDQIAIIQCGNIRAITSLIFTSMDNAFLWYFKACKVPLIFQEIRDTCFLQETLFCNIISSLRSSVT